MTVIHDYKTVEPNLAYEWVKTGIWGKRQFLQWFTYQIENKKEAV